MADTVRTIADLKALLANNTTGAISPQDLRDFLETFRQDHGEISMDTPTATSVSVASDWLKVDGTTALSSGTQMRFDDDSGQKNRLRYTGTTTRIMHIAVSISMTCASNNQVLEFAVIKNGAVSGSSITDVNSAASVIQRKVGTGTDVGSTALHAFIPMTTNDYIELYGRNTTSTANFTVETLNMVAIGMPNG